ncbi:MAG: hypothetical protein K9M45_01570 [Kiritimatiellales bacterium]|nr:hypothetical protein [Kiritimatiellales bacterium]
MRYIDGSIERSKDFGMIDGRVSRKSQTTGSAELFVQHERWTADRWRVMFNVGMLKFAIGAECTDKQQAERLRDDFADALSQLGINLPNSRVRLAVRKIISIV